MGAWSERTIEERARAAHAARNAILPYIRDSLDLTMPWRSDRLSTRTSFDHIYDSTAPINVQRSASRLQRDFTPPFQRWFELEAGPLVPPAMQERLNRDLEIPTQIAHAVLDAGAFHKASHESYSDLLVGTGALLATEGDDRDLVRWSAAPAWQLGIEEGPSGRVDNTYWDKGYPAWLLPRHWPKAVWPEKVRELIAGMSTEIVKVRQAAYFDAEYGNWRLAIVCVDSAANQSIVWESEHRTNPWIVFRYWTTPGDPWGRGPIMLMLPDIRTANKTVEMVLKAAAYQLAPPLMVLHDGVVNPDQLRLAPQALIRVARTGGPMGRSIEPLDVGSRMDTGQIVLDDLRQNISKGLLATQLPPDSGAVRSASEIIERAKQLAFDGGAAFGRLNHEFVPQVVARVLDILDRKKVATIDWNAMKIDQLLLRVKVTSPLARAQNLEDAQAVVQFWEMAKVVGGEEAFLQVCNTEDGLPKLAKVMGVPLWAVNDEQRRRQLAEAAGEMAANALQAQAAGPQGAEVTSLPLAA